MFRIAVQEKSGEYVNNWCEGIKATGNSYICLDMRTEYGFNEARNSDGVMWHIGMRPSIQSAASSILPALENYTGKVVFPNYKTRWHLAP